MAAATARGAGGSRPVWWGVLLGKLGLLGVVLYFVGRAMARQTGGDPRGDVQFRAGWLGLSLVTICVATFVSTISFSLLFARSGHAPGLGPWRSDVAVRRWASTCRASSRVLRVQRGC